VALERERLASVERHCYRCLILSHTVALPGRRRNLPRIISNF
jgi:hypothetical protein